MDIATYMGVDVPVFNCPNECFMRYVIRGAIDVYGRHIYAVSLALGTSNKVVQVC